MKCRVCRKALPEVEGEIEFNRRQYCAEHLSVYLLTRTLRKRGMSKRDAAAELLRVIAKQKTPAEQKADATQ
jgi:hypothetical protein